LDLLVRQVVDGDQQATGQLFRYIHPIVLSFCRARLGRQETVLGAADDVAQEVALAVVRALSEYVPRGLSFRSFVYAVTAHKIADAFRTMGRNRVDPVADTPDIPLAHDGPEHRILEYEQSRALGTLMEHLTPRQREVLTLRIVLGYTALETAQVIGSTKGAVRVTQHRAIRRLRRKLQNQAAAGDAASADESSVEE
jgi:RNA polymerase sigma-70 factor (ECF subfamily)